MPKKTSEFPAATVVTGAEFLVRQTGNKRLSLAILQSWVQGLISTFGLGVATQAEAEAATSNAKASSPARVREYLEQFGLSAAFTTAVANLNDATKGQIFSWSNTSANSPVASSFGRGITLPSGAGYVTQLGIINDSGDTYVRFQSAATWGAWIKIAPSAGGGSSGPQTAVLAADVGVTAITLANVFSLNVVANKVYRLDANLFMRTTAVAKGYACGVGGTAGFQSISAKAMSFDTAGAAVNRFTKTKDAVMSFPTSNVGGDDNFLEITGLFYTTAPGTLLVKIAAAVEFDYCAAQKGSGASLLEVGTIAAE